MKIFARVRQLSAIDMTLVKDLGVTDDEVERLKPFASDKWMESY